MRLHLVNMTDLSKLRHFSTAISSETKSLTPSFLARTSLVKGGEIRDTKNPKLGAQHCFVASLGGCLPFLTLHDQLVAQQKHLLRVEESCCEK